MKHTIFFKPDLQKRYYIPTAVNMLFQTLSVSLRYLFNERKAEYQPKTANRYINNYCRKILHITQTTVYLHEEKVLDQNTSYILMSNHISLLDIQIIGCVFKGKLRMIAKEQLSKIPIFGHALIKSGFIPIDRKNRARAIKQLEIAKKQLQQGLSVWLAPEGTRSRDGKLKKFKKGGFHIAIELQLPIVPIWISGAQNVIKADSLRINKKKDVHVLIGAPIETKNFSKLNIDSLILLTRNAMLKLENQAKILEDTVTPTGQ